MSRQSDRCCYSSERLQLLDLATPVALKTRSVHLHVLDTHMEGREPGLWTERGYPGMPDHVRLS